MDLVTLIDSLGYPFAITVVMAYFIKYVFDKNTTITEDIMKIIENNTAALTAMKEELSSLKESEENGKSCD